MGGHKEGYMITSSTVSVIRSGGYQVRLTHKDMVTFYRLTRVKTSVPGKTDLRGMIENHLGKEQLAEIKK